MIYVQMSGRFGNQLFHYACARYVQVKTGDKKLIMNYGPVLGQHRESEGWVDVLKDLNVTPYEYYERPGTVLKNETSVLQKILVGIKAVQIKLNSKLSREERASKAQWFSAPLNCVGIYWIREGMNYIAPNPKRKKHIVTGTCECPNVFDEIGDILREELTPINPPLKENKTLLKEIEGTDSICINVRRGDFYNASNIKSFGVCTPEYYRKAYSKMLEQEFANPHFFIVSDDINWCKENLIFPGNGGGITFIPDGMPPYETMRLISSCKHFVVSNSTFSWWGAYLSKNKSKVIISPSRWNNDGYDSQLIGKNWILIDP